MNVLLTVKIQNQYKLKCELAFFASMRCVTNFIIDRDNTRRDSSNSVRMRALGGWPAQAPARRGGWHEATGGEAEKISSCMRSSGRAAAENNQMHVAGSCSARLKEIKKLMEFTAATQWALGCRNKEAIRTENRQRFFRERNFFVGVHHQRRWVITGIAKPAGREHDSEVIEAHECDAAAVSKLAQKKCQCFQGAKICSW